MLTTTQYEEEGEHEWDQHCSPRDLVPGVQIHLE
jgi:hypothetical protein